MSNKIENFKNLIKFLNNNGIHYAVLGRRQSLNEIVDGDIDLVVSNKNFKKIELIINDYCSQYTLDFIQTIQHESTAKYMIVADRKDHSIICPDICSHYVRDARCLIKNDILLKNAISARVDGFSVQILNPYYEFLYYFLKKIDKKSIGTHEFKHLLEQFKLVNVVKWQQIMQQYFKVKSVEIIQNIFKAEDREQLEKFIILFRRELHQNKTKKISFWFQDRLLKFNRIFKMTGLSITMMGPDGCGKSTVIEAITKSLHPAFRTVKYYHLKPIDKKTVGDVSTPHAQKPYGPIKSLFKILYLIYQYNKGFVKVYLKMIRSTFVIFDRYYDDILIDKLRFRYGAPNFIAKLASYCIPKPKLYFLLDAPSQVIYERKNELQIEEIERQRGAYLKLFAKGKKSFIVDASVAQQEVIFNVERLVLDYLKSRQLKRL